MVLRGWLRKIERYHPGVYARMTDLRDRLAPGYGEPERALVPLLAEADAAAFDVGACNGIYTHRMAQHAARVVAFEPNPRLADVLRRRFAAEMRSGKVRLETCALGDVEGEIDLHVPRDASGLASVQGERLARAGAATDSVRVPLRRLDSFSAEGEVAFVKIDVEGFEVEVVKGAEALIARDRPSLLIEAEERCSPGSLAALTGLLAPAGYRGFYLHEGRIRPLETFEPAVLQNVAALNETGTLRRKGGVYINNFLFVARDAVRRRLADLE